MMENHLGFRTHGFDGIVSGVTEFGVFVQLIDSHCEGLLHVRELSASGNQNSDGKSQNAEDYWNYSEEDYCLINERTGEKLTLGDKLRVEVIRADALKRQIDFRRAVK